MLEKIVKWRVYFEILRRSVEMTSRREAGFKFPPTMCVLRITL